MERLKEEQLAAELTRRDGWTIPDGKWMEKRYRFTSFMLAISFVSKVADAAEALQHHPMIAIDFRVVTLRLTTWSAGGLTALDFESADKFDMLALEINRQEGD